MEEERRLFYVAITRAKEKLFLVTEKGNESSFLKEIPDIFTVKTTIPINQLLRK
jgi:superfamily I DNA/RNA helicase